MTAGKPWTDQQIATAVGGDVSENLALLAELFENRVCSRTKTGAVFSRRIVRDEEMRADDAKRQRDKRKALKESSCPSNVQSVSGASPPNDIDTDIKPPLPEKDERLPDELNFPEFKTAWSDYIAYREESKLKALKPRSVSQQFQRMAKWVAKYGLPAVVDAIHETIAQGWQGLFEPKPNLFKGRSTSDAIGVAAEWAAEEKQRQASHEN